MLSKLVVVVKSSNSKIRHAGEIKLISNNNYFILWDNYKNREGGR